MYDYVVKLSQFTYSIVLAALFSPQEEVNAKKYIRNT